MIPFSQERLFIKGKKELNGDIFVSGSKNAVLPILAASLAINGISKIKNIPILSDTKGFIDIMQSIGAKVIISGNDVEVDARNLQGDGTLNHTYICKMRASILFLAPLLIRFGRVKMPFPGGCVLGKRSVDSHLHIFSNLGAEIVESKNYLELKLKGKEFLANTVVLPEISVTATENAIVAMAFAKGNSFLRLAASEPHIQNLCDFLESAGACIKGKGGHSLSIENSNKKQTAEVTVVSDYLQIGTYILAGVLTNSELKIHNFESSHLDSFLERLSQTNASFEIDEKSKTITTKKRKTELVASNIQTGVFPKFATDLHPQFAVLLTQCNGRSKIFETLFERKFAYLLELEKMGAKVEINNPHVFHIEGPVKLQGTSVASQDIRAGAAMILAGLVAEGETEISNIHYIDRGYDNIMNNLKDVGAEIRKENVKNCF